MLRLPVNRIISSDSSMQGIQRYLSSLTAKGNTLLLSILFSRDSVEFITIRLLFGKTRVYISAGLFD